MADLAPLLTALKESIASMAGSIKTRFTNVQDRVIQAHDGLLQKKQTTVIVIGDSLTRGSILEDSREGWVNLFANSLYELHDNVNKNERSVGYPVMFNMEEMNTRPDITYNGEVNFDSAISLSGSNVRLKHGEFIELTDREASVVTIYYDNTVFAGNAGVFEIYLNGELKGTRPVLATGFNKTEPFVLTKLAGDPVISTDKVKIVYKATSANATHLVCVVGLSFARPNTNNGPVVLNVNQPGWTYENFMPLLPKIAQVAEWNKFDDESDQVYLVYLTANAMYNPAYIQTPVEMAASLNTMVTTLGINGTTKRLIPVFHYLVGDGVAPSGTHSEYLAGVKAVCKTHGLMLLDLTDVKLGQAFFPDGIHPTAPGYAALASHICAGLGIPFNPKNQAKDLAALSWNNSDISLTPTWWPAGVNLEELLKGPSRAVAVHAEDTGSTGCPPGMLEEEGGIVTFMRSPNGDTLGILEMSGFVSHRVWRKIRFGPSWTDWVEKPYSLAYDKTVDNDHRITGAPDLLLKQKQTTVTIIGDSITSGYNLLHSDMAWPTLFSNSLFELYDNPEIDQRSLGYQTMFNLTELSNHSQITTNGTFAQEDNITVAGTSLTLKHDEFIEIEGREASVLALYYDNDVKVANPGRLEFFLNGALKGSVALETTAGFKKTDDFVLTKIMNDPIVSTDKIKIVYKSTAANAAHSVCLTGLQLRRPNTNNGAAVLNISQTGWTFAKANARLPKIAQAVEWNKFDANTEQLFIACLGGNDMISAEGNLSPAELALAVKNMADGLGVDGISKRLVVWMNYILDPGWGVQGSFPEFRKALQDVSDEEGYGFIDCSHIKMMEHLNPSDIHPNETGQAIIASHMCASLGIPFNPKNQAKDLAALTRKTELIDMNPVVWPNDVDVTEMINGPSRTVHAYGTHWATNGLPEDIGTEVGIITFTRGPNEGSLGVLKCQSYFSDRTWYKGKFGTWGDGWVESEQSRAFKIADNDRFRVIQAPDLLLQEKQTTVTIIGDSLSSGFGLTHTDKAWPTLFSNSLFEAFDNPDTNKRSVGYQTMFNMKEAANCRGMTTNGTFIEENTHTISGQGLILKHNQFLEVTGREASVLTVYYDNDAVVGKAGEFEYYLNDELKGSAPIVTSAGFKKTDDFVLTKLLNYPVISTDKVKIVYKATSADADDSICMVGLQLIRPKTDQGAVVLNINHPGWNFTQFNSRLAKINQAVGWHNNSGATDQVYLAFMGANSWWSATNTQSPEDLVASIKTMAGGIGINGKDKRMVIWMSYIIEPGWPAIGSYNDFLKALQKLATEEGYGFVDCSTLKMQQHFLPGDFHPTEAGHAILAQHVCKNLGVSYNPKNQAKDLAVKVQQLAEVTQPTQWWPANTPITEITKGPSRTILVLGEDAEAAGLPPETWALGAIVTYIKTPGSPVVEVIKAQHTFNNHRWIKTKFGDWGDWTPDANITLPPRLDALEGPMVWNDLTILSPWVWDPADATDFFKPSYAIRGNRVYLRGKIKLPGEHATAPIGNHIFTLPSGAQPVKKTFGLCVMSTTTPFFFGSFQYIMDLGGEFKFLTAGPSTPTPFTDCNLELSQLSFDLSP